MQIKITNNEVIIDNTKSKVALKSEYQQVLNNYKETISELYPQNIQIDKLKKQILQISRKIEEYKENIESLKQQLSLAQDELNYYEKEDKGIEIIKYVEKLFSNFDYIQVGNLVFIKATGLLWLNMNNGKQFDYYSRLVEYLNKNAVTNSEFDLPNINEISEFKKYMPHNVFFSSSNLFWKGMQIGSAGDDYFNAANNWNNVYLNTVNRAFLNIIKNFDYKKEPEKYCVYLLMFLYDNKLITPNDELIKIASGFIKKYELEMQIIKYETLLNGCLIGDKIIRNIVSEKTENEEMSKVSYCQKLLELFEESLEMIDNFNKDEAELLSHAAEVLKNINESVEEFDNEILLQRTQSLQNVLNFSTVNLYQKIISFKKEAEKLNEEIKEANSLSLLYEFENKELPSFTIIQEKIAMMIDDQMDKIEWFKENQEMCDKVVEIHTDWCNQLREYLNVTTKYFCEKCQDNSIDKEVFDVWVNEYDEVRFFVELHLSPLIKSAFDKIITLNSVVEIVEQMKVYLIDKINDFYFEDLIPIHQKYSFNGWIGKLHEKLEIEGKLQNIYFEFQQKIENVIFSVENTEGKIFLLRWAQKLFNIQISNLVEYFSKNNYSDIISLETLQKFRELNKINIDSAIKDSHAYLDSAQQRNEDFTSLIFKMRKEAEKINNKSEKKKGNKH